MENIALFIMSVSLLLLIIIVGILLLIFFKLIKNLESEKIRKSLPNQNKNELNPNQDISPKNFFSENNEKDLEDFNCNIHKDRSGEQMCAICHKYFCNLCIRPFKTLHVCQMHLPLLLKNEWKEVLTVESTSEKPENGIQLFELKKNLYARDKIPTFVTTHYKINVDCNQIETFTVLYALDPDISKVKMHFRKLGIQFSEN